MTLKEKTLLEETLRYIPSFSTEIKLDLLCFIFYNICREFCIDHKTCDGCPIGPSLCRQLENLRHLIILDKDEDEE